jgi:predicted transcriptional regulator
MATEELTERETQLLEHVRTAQERGSTLVEYASSAGLDVKALYEVKRQLVKKGVIARRAGTKKRQKRGRFAQARIVAALPQPIVAAVACRLLHPNGRVLECVNWPQAQWMAAVLAGDAHAAS